MSEDPKFKEGMQTRRKVLGDEHVDRAIANTDDFTRDFQEFLTRYAWGEIWNRPGLTRQTRSMLTMAILVALRNEDELRMHIRAGLRGGVSAEEIREVFLHCAVYCGLPAANQAFHIAQEVLSSME